MIDSKLAILIRKPSTPCERSACRASRRQQLLAVINDPQRNVASIPIVPSVFKLEASLAKKISAIPGPSPRSKHIGNNTMALRRFVYHERRRALPSTTLRLSLITTEWRAVIPELTTPKKTPSIETEVPSRKTPMKKPMVTTLHATKIRRDGMERNAKNEVTMVKGRTSPRAT